MDFIIPAAANKEGNDYSLLDLCYDRVLEQRARELGHVAMIIGGVEKKEKKVGQTGPVFTPVSYERQKSAMKLLHEEGFNFNPVLIKRELLDLIEPSGNVDQINNTSINLMKSLLNDVRVQRMIDTETKAAKGEKVYQVNEMVTDLVDGIFSELNQRNFVIDPYRRKLQRNMVEELNLKLNPEKPVVAAPVNPFAPPVPNVGITDLRPIARGKLVELKKKINSSLLKTTDKVTLYHLQDLNAMIDKSLESKK